MRFIDKEVQDLKNFAGGLEAALTSEADAYRAGQAKLLQVLKDEPIVPKVQIKTVERAMRHHWQLTDYKAVDGTVHVRQKNFTMVIAPDGSYKRFKS